MAGTPKKKTQGCWWFGRDAEQYTPKHEPGSMIGTSGSGSASTWRPDITIEPWAFRGAAYTPSSRTFA